MSNGQHPLAYQPDRMKNVRDGTYAALDIIVNGAKSSKKKHVKKARPSD